MTMAIEPPWMAPIIGVCIAVIMFGVAAAIAFRD